MENTKIISCMNDCNSKCLEIQGYCDHCELVIHTYQTLHHLRGSSGIFHKECVIELILKNRDKE